MKKLYRFPKLIVLVVMVITAFFSYQLKNVKIDNDTEKFVPATDPSRVEYDRHEELFGGSEIITIMVESRRGNIFTPEAISTIYDMTEEIETHALIEDVMSLTNTDYIEGIDGAVVVKPLVDDFTGSQEDVNQLKNKILSWDVYDSVLISNDFSSSQILATIEPVVTVDGHADIYKDLTKIMDKYRSDDLNFYIAGLPVVNVLFSEYMVEDLNKLIPFVVVILLLTLFLSFKRFSGVILPLLTVVVSTIWTLGLMGLLDVHLSMLGTIIPVVMIAVGSAYGIHIISHYYDDLKNISHDITKDKHTGIVGKVVKSVGRPILLAGLTTIAGFGSLSVSKVVPMKEFGIFTSVGIVASLTVALTLIPSLLILKFRHINIEKEKKRGEKANFLSSFLDIYYTGIGKRKYLLTFFALVILLLSIIGTSKMVIDNSFIDYFKDDTEIKISDTFAREQFTGTKVIDVVVEGESVGCNPAILKGLDDLGKYLVKTYPEVAKASSLADPLKRLNQVMHVDSLEKDEKTDDEQWSDDSSEFEDESFFGDLASYEDEESEILESNYVAPFFDNMNSTDFMNMLTASYALSHRSDLSASELIKALKRNLNYNGYAFFEVPTDPKKYGQTEGGLKNLISQYYVSGGTEDYIGEDDDSLSPNHIKMSVMLNTTGDVFTSKLLSDIKELTAEYLPEGTKVSYSGGCLQESALTEIITSSSVQSVTISLLIVFIILAIYFKSIIAGLLGIIPLGFTVLVNYAVMGFFGIKLDMTTGMLGSIAIGIGVDYTIHFLDGYRNNALKGGREDEITRKTLQSSGKAIIVNAVSVALGFAVLIASNFNPIMNLGLLITLTMCVASTASLTIMPSLLNIIKPKFTRR